MPAIAHRLTILPTYVFASIGARLQAMAKEGIDVIRLDIGSPDQPPPPAVVEKLCQSAQNPNNHSYSAYTGLPAFRQAVARYYQRRFGVSLDPDREVLPLIGSKEGLVNLALAYLDRGDLSLVPSMGYPAYSMGSTLAGAEVCWTPLAAANNYLIDFESIPADVAQRGKLLWINYPNNPTGACADLAFYQRAVDYCTEHDILLVSDNPYVEVTFDDFVAPSALQAEGAKNTTIEFMSLSKTYNMAGWRLGAAVGNAAAITNLLQIKSNMDSGHFKPIYEAGIVALDDTIDEWHAARNMLYRVRRDRILATLPQIGLEAAVPKGAIYVWARVQDGDGDYYTEQALTQAHVSVAPGSAYGPDGKNYVRLSLGTPDVRLDEALERLKAWYASH